MVPVCYRLPGSWRKCTMQNFVRLICRSPPVTTTTPRITNQFYSVPIHSRKCINGYATFCCAGNERGGGSISSAVGSVSMLLDQLVVFGSVTLRDPFISWFLLRKMPACNFKPRQQHCLDYRTYPSRYELCN